MKICHCFIGLLRSIHTTAEHLKTSLFYTGYEYDVICVTWESEDTTLFQSIFPGCKIFKVPNIQQKDNKEFEDWQEGLQLHISLRRSEEQGWPHDGNSGKFHYYRQLYLLNKASNILDLLQKINNYDVMTRLRTDIIIHSESPIYNKYELVTNKRTIYFANEYRHFIKNEGEGCPDQFYMGSPDAIIFALKALDYTKKYKITYTETSPKWVSTPTLEENIIQPESILYYFLKGEDYDVQYLPYKIEIIRS